MNMTEKKVKEKKMKVKERKRERMVRLREEFEMRQRPWWCRPARAGGAPAQHAVLQGRAAGWAWRVQGRDRRMSRSFARP